MNRFHHMTVQRFKGFTLLEVIIALVIMSVGLLGMAGLQMRGLKSNQVAYQRSQATILAYDMADRLRANKTAINQKTLTSDITYSINSACMTPDGCSSLDMLKNDIALWKQRLQETLPGAEGVVCLDETPFDGTADEHSCSDSGESYAVKIWWEEQDDTNDENTRFVVSFIP